MHMPRAGTAGWGLGVLAIMALLLVGSILLPGSSVVAEDEPEDEQLATIILKEPLPLEDFLKAVGQITEIPAEVMVTTQGRTFRRRGKPHRPCDQQLIRDMFELTSDDRQLPQEPLAF